MGYQRRVHGLRSPTIATRDSAIGRRDGPLPRRHGVAKTRARGALPHQAAVLELRFKNLAMVCPGIVQKRLSSSMLANVPSTATLSSSVLAIVPSSGMLAVISQS